MACVMRSTYLSFCPIMFSSPVEKERAQVLLVFFILRVVFCVSSLVFIFFFFSAASSITYLFALKSSLSPIERAWKAVSCFFFQHTCRTLCRFLLPSPIEKACACLWVGRRWGCIPCLSFVLSPSSCILRLCVRLRFRPLGPFPRIVNILVRHTSIPLFPRGTWPFPIARACVCLRAGRCGVSYLVFPCSCLRLLARCGLVYVCACVRGPSLWRPPSHC